MMKKRLIVLIDLSEYSRLLLVLAHSWAQEANAELLIVHQSTLLIPAVGEGEIISEIKADNRKNALQKLSSFVFETVGKSVVINFHVTSGHLEAALSMLKKSKNIEAILVGMKDKNFIEKILMGSTAIKLTNEIDKIIVALPEATINQDYDTLYVAVKKKYPLDEKEFRNLLTLAENKIKKIHLFSILKDNEEATETVDYMKIISVHYGNQIPITYDIHRTDNAFEYIKEYMLNNKGLLVVQKGSRTLIDLFRKYFVNDMINYAKIPLVILP